MPWSEIPVLEGLLHHGGGLRAAARRYGRPLGDWLDLSTGINPRPWPVPALPDELWHRLPETDDGLAEAAAAHYGGPPPLPVAGSQAAIQGLPVLRRRGRIGVLSPGYAEHAQAWRRQGHAVVPLAAAEIPATLDRLDVLVVIRPNNPTGECLPTQTLLDWAGALAARGGWLIVDEAFIDARPAESLVGETERTAGLVVLRSLGKFFGLAGARVGFVFAEDSIRHRLESLLGPWPISTAARWLARQALDDDGWAARTRTRLALDSHRLRALLDGVGLRPGGGCALFQWCPDERAAVVHAALARAGILSRLFEAPAALRFGLPGREADWSRLADGLAAALREAG